MGRRCNGIAPSCTAIPRAAAGFTLGPATESEEMLRLEVLTKDEARIRCRVLIPGELRSRRHINLPGVKVNLPSFTEKDRSDATVGLEAGIDFLALSFVREAKDIELLRAVEPFLMTLAADPNDTIESAIGFLRREGRIAVGDKIVIATDILAHDRLVDSVQLRTVQ